jgi:hypothetical protein
MTAFCLGGPSGPKDGIPLDIQLGTAGISALINNIPTPWAVAAALSIGAVNYHFTTFCAVDPPADPGITTADMQAFADGLFVNPGAYLATVAKVTQLVDRYMWFQMCQCTTITTPATPAGPTDPGGYTVINPPTGIAPTSTNPCAAYAPPEFTTFDFNVGHPVLGYRNTPQVLYALPPGVTSADLTMDWSVASGTGAFLDTEFDWYDNTKTLITFFGQQLGPGHANHLTRHQVLPTNAAFFDWWYTGSTAPGTGTSLVKLGVTFTCGTGGAAATPCCPPDPIATSKLDQLIAAVTLIQRQVAPFAYVVKDTITGLSGNGEQTVQGLLGAMWTITATIPHTIGAEDGDPEPIFGAGWFNWGDATGFGAREFLSSVDVLSFPPAAGVYTRLAYSLPPGVVVTLRTLAREP